MGVEVSAGRVGVADVEDAVGEDPSGWGPRCSEESTADQRYRSADPRPELVCRSMVPHTRRTG